MRSGVVFVIMLVAALCITLSSSEAATLTVFNTQDAGQGSLRQAMTDANNNPGSDLIIFRIPLTDPNYDAGLGVWTIRPLNALPTILDPVGIDGLSQSAFIGADTNPLGPEIQIAGTLAGLTCGITFESAGSAIRDLVINRFQRCGVFINGHDADNNRVMGCYIGIDPTGTSARPNGASGIMLYTGPQGNTIGGIAPGERNIISGNDFAGVEIEGVGANTNTVSGNYVGTNAQGTAAVPNDFYGLYVWSGAQNNLFESNLVSGNSGDAVYIVGSSTSQNRLIGNRIGTNAAGNAAIPNGMSGVAIASPANVIGEPGGRGNVISGNDGYGVVIAATGNTVAGNMIGTDVSGTAPLPNGLDGVALTDGAQNNTIGPQNRIAWNGGNGVLVTGATTIRNKITTNSIAFNTGLGISNEAGGNTELAPPEIDEFTPIHVSGHAPANSVVEIFSDSADEGAIFEGATVANAAGAFMWNGAASGPHVTATATDGPGNTSEFSRPAVSGAPDDPLVAVAAVYGQPNPFCGITTLRYDLPAAADLSLRIYDATGRSVRDLVSQRAVAAGSGEAAWDGRDDRGRSLAAGTYYYRLEAGRYRATGSIALAR